MNTLKEFIEKEHSKRMAIQVAYQIIASEKKKKELFELILRNEKVIAQRAAYVLSVAIDINPKVFSSLDNQEKLVQFLALKNAHKAIYRNTLKALFFSNIKKPLKVIVLEKCYRFLMQPKEEKAIQVYAIKLIAKISRPYPELQEELKRFLSNFPQEQPPSIQSALRYVEQVFEC